MDNLLKIQKLKKDPYFKRIFNKIKDIFYQRERSIEEIIEIVDGNVENLTTDDLTLEENIKLLNHREMTSTNIDKYIELFLSDLKIKRSGGILSKNGSKNNTLIPNNFYSDMEVFENSDINYQSNNTVFDVVNKTDTAYGKYILKEVLKHPTNDINLLSHRQNVVKELFKLRDVSVSDPNKHNLLQELYLEMAQLGGNIERDILWFWDNNDTTTNTLLDLVYFNSILKIFNKNETFLYLSNMYNIFISPISSALSPLMSIILPYILLKVFKVPVKVSDFKTVIGGIMGSGEWSYKSIFSIGIWLFFYLQNIFAMFKTAMSSYKVINIIHQKINNLAFFLERGINMFKIIKKYGINLNLNDDNSTLASDTNELETAIETFDNLINKHSLFHSNPSILSNKGKILATYKIFNDNKTSMIPIFNFVAKLDFYIGLTKLHDTTINNVININKNTNTNTTNNITEGFTFTYKMPKYLQNNVKLQNNLKQNKIRRKPKLMLEGIWHPCLDRNIPNNIIINNKSNNKSKSPTNKSKSLTNKSKSPIKNMLITGPNASGKSTYIKSVSIAILLAQTIGLCPVSVNSRVQYLTPFKVLNSYLKNIDVKGSRSGFEAEMYKCKEHINLVKELEKDEYSFVAMDEILVTTNYKEGVAGAYAICKELSRHHNSVALITTHYTNLSTFKDDQFTYFKFNITRDDKDEIVYTYKMKKGISNDYIALELLKKNGFEERIINDAINISSIINMPQIK